MARRSQTESFGTPKREGHNSSTFYAMKLYDTAIPDSELVPSVSNLSDVSNKVVWEDGSGSFNKIYCGDSRRMPELPDDSVHLVVTSPPYNVGKDYDKDLSLGEYRELLRGVFAEVYRVLVPGGRVCINVANIGRRPYIPLHAYITADMLELGYLMRGEIIWDKGAGAGVSCAWGSFASATNPVLRDVHEYILVFCKNDFRREKCDKHNTIANESFVEWTKSVWRFGTESAKRVGHPAPFPIELPKRFIELYTFAGDVVLDPFCGSGTTCVAAMQSDRNYVGYDISNEYAHLAVGRIEQIKGQLRQGNLHFG